MPLESGASEFDRLAGEQSLMALATVGLFAKPVRGNTVDRIAMGTNDVYSFTHVKNPDSANTNVLGPAKSNPHTQAAQQARMTDTTLIFINGGCRRCFKPDCRRYRMRGSPGAEGAEGCENYRGADGRAA